MKVAYETKVRVAYAAILCPDEFNNYKFWDLIYQLARQDVTQIDKAARHAGITIQSIREPDVFFPPLDSLVKEIALNCVNPKEIFNIIKQCATSPNTNMDWIDQYLPNNQQNVTAPNSNDSDNSDDSIDNPHHSIKKIVDNTPWIFIGTNKVRQENRDTSTATPNQTMPLNQNKALSRTPCCSLNLRILGGFMSTLGIVAVMFAFAALNAATFAIPGLIVASIGIASLLTGVGLFCSASNQSKKQDPQQAFVSIPNAGMSNS